MFLTIALASTNSKNTIFSGLNVSSKKFNNKSLPIKSLDTWKFKIPKHSWVREGLIVEIRKHEYE